MGQMRFVIPRPERLVAGAAEQAYLAGAEGIPWECRDDARRRCADRSSATPANRAISIFPGTSPAAAWCSSARAA